MFPFNFEWIWDGSHIVFMGGLWYALNIIGMAMTYCIIKAIYDTYKAKDDRSHYSSFCGVFKALPIWVYPWKRFFLFVK